MSDQKTVLITGSSTGFGKLTALTLARTGYCVKASMRNTTTSNRAAAQELEATAKKEKLDLSVVELDVLDSRSVDKAVDHIISQKGKIDVLMNNAGAFYLGLTEAFTEKQMINQFNTNVFSMMRLNRAVLPHMRQKKSGLIISLSSVIGRMVVPFAGLYCATKFAVEALAESLRYELAPLGIDSVILEPSAYPTPIGSKTSTPEDQKVVAGYGATNSLQNKIPDAFNKIYTSAHPPEPQDIADAVLRLIKMPAGERPLRTVVGNDFGCKKINAASESVQKNVLRMFGLEALEHVKPLSKV